MLAIPPELVERIRSGEAVLVAGSGFEARSELTGWVSILRGLLEALGSDGEATVSQVEDLLARGRLAGALALLRQRLPDRALAAQLAHMFPRGAAVPEVMAAAAALPWYGIAYTTFGDSWSRAVAATERRYGEIDGLALAETGAGVVVAAGGHFLLPALGTVEGPGGLCLGSADLRRRGAAAAAAAFLQDRFSERPFVFLGFSQGDPDLALILERMLGCSVSGSEHYLVFESARDAPLTAAESLGAELDVRAIPYPGSLTEIVAALNAAGPRAVTPVPISVVDARSGSVALVSDSPSGPRDDLGGVTPDEWLRATRQEIDGAGPAQQPTLFEKMGDVYHQRLGSTVQAIASYQAALRLEPGRRPVIEKLVELYCGHKHFRPAEELLGRLIDSESVPDRRAQLLLRAGLLQRDELDNTVRAAQMLARALEDDPGQREAYEALENMLAQQKNWPLLAKLCQKVLSLAARPTVLGPRAQEVRRLAAERLVQVAAERLGDDKLVMMALEAAPPDAANRERLADLYAKAGAGHETRAIAMHHALLVADPDRLASYRALADLYRSTGAQDRFACLAATLTFLRKGDDELREVYEKARQSGAFSGPPLATALSAEAWALLAHADEDPRQTALLALVGGCVISSRSESLDQLVADGLRLLDAATAPGLIAKASALAVVAGVGSVELFVDPRPEAPPATIRFLRHGDRTAGAVILSGAAAARPDNDETYFVVAEALARLRPEKALTVILAPKLAESMVRAALHVAGVRPPLPSEREEIERLAAELRAFMPRGNEGDLAGAGRQLRGDFPDLAKWRAGVDHSVCRAAFVLLPDLIPAARALAATGRVGGVPTKKLLKDLVGFSVSEPYFKLRALGGS